MVATGASETAERGGVSRALRTLQGADRIGNCLGAAIAEHGDDRHAMPLGQLVARMSRPLVSSRRSATR
jgi:hypothetical protein